MNTINIPDEELNSYIKNTCGSFPCAKKWQRIDVGTLETYVGDGEYVITVIDYKPKSVKQMERNCRKVEETVTRYLIGEGFIGKNYLYVGLQQFNLTSLPQGL